MFLFAATWTRAVGLRGQHLKLYQKLLAKEEVQGLKGEVLKHMVRVVATTHDPPHENTPKTAKTYTFKLVINQQPIEANTLN